MRSIAVLMLATAMPLCAQDSAHKFFDRANLIGFGVSAAMRSADAAYTCRRLNEGNFREVFYPTQSCRGVAVWMAATYTSEISLSYLFHKRGQHRLERWVPRIGATASGIGLTWNLSRPHYRYEIVRRPRYDDGVQHHE
jgi:hypothetical protein